MASAVATPLENQFSMIAGLQGPNVGEPASVLAGVKHRIGPGELTEEQAEALLDAREASRAEAKS